METTLGGKKVNNRTWRGNVYIKMMVIFSFFVLQMGCGGGGGGGATSASLVGVGAISKVTPDVAAEVTSASTVSATFNRDMDAATINSSTFQITGPDGAISGSVSYDSGSKIAMFVPIAPLLPLADYTATLTTGVKDQSGKSLDNSYSWSFKTSKDILARPATDVIPATLFGQHMHRAATTTVWPTSPFGTWRLWDAYVAWPNLEPHKGEWHFETLDKYVAMAELHNVELVLPLALSPQWASARPTETSAYGLGNAAEPMNIDDWKNYVRTVATRYSGKIHYYEFWNEPNLNSFYSGSVDKLIELNREAYKILKEIDPTVKIVSPSCTGGGNGLIWLNDYLVKGGAENADIIGYHFYVTPGAPEAMVALITKVKQILVENDVAKPLWNTEAGWYIENHNSTVAPEGSFSKVLTDDEASAYVARSYVLNWATSVDRFYWYAWDNGNMGFVETDGKTVKPPAEAYAQTYSWLSGARMISCGQNSKGTWAAGIIKTNGQPAWIVWNTDKTLTMELPKEWKAKLMRDLAGNVTDIATASQVNVSPMPLFIER